MVGVGGGLGEQGNLLIAAFRGRGLSLTQVFSQPCPCLCLTHSCPDPPILSSLPSPRAPVPTRLGASEDRDPSFIRAPTPSPGPSPT